MGSALPPELVLEAYRMGAFPMGEARGMVSWHSPDPRGILPLDRFRVPHGLRRALRRGRYEVRVDADFGGVIRACAARRETWITPTIIACYEELHRMGHAHSVESWLEGRLAGGLYGVALGGAFFGESMFSLETDASKVALHALVERMRSRGYVLLDVQWVTPHLRQFGGIEIPRGEYMRRLRGALKMACRFVD